MDALKYSVEELMKIVTLRFFNVGYLKLENLLKIDDECLVALCKWSILTILDVTWSIGLGFRSHMPRNITDMGMHSLGSE